MAGSHFGSPPERPRSNECQSAFVILCNAHDASGSFLDTFRAVRTAREARGAPTDEEQDLLRACLVFAGAGLDSMTKQLVRDALPAVIDKQQGAEAMFRQHVERHVLRDEGEGSIGALADVLADRNPRRRLVERVVRDLTAGSLQSAEELMRVGAYFDIASSKLVPDRRALQEIFAARNQIVHEMDVDFAQVNRNRRSRRLSTMTTATNDLFEIASTLLGEVDVRITG